MKSKSLKIMGNTVNYENPNLSGHGGQHNFNQSLHFMGIGGSGLSGVAILAKKKGYKISGCDLEKTTPYLEKVKKAGIKVFEGHALSHLEGIDTLIISPAVVYQSSTHPEYKLAREKKIAKTWDEFVGEDLLKGKKVICIAGTHGKSTTTSLAGFVFEKAGVDPNVLVGAKVHGWNANYRVGNSDLFIIESDEFYDKFLNYNPQIIILNNIEFDHPDYFNNENALFNSFKKFVYKLSGSKILILNLDSEGVKKLYSMIPGKFLAKFKTYGYTLSQKPLFKVKNNFFATITERNTDFTSFTVFSKELNLDEVFKIKILGDYNVANSLGVIILSSIFKINPDIVKNSLREFEGTERRLELIKEVKGISVYDDYAHHPTAVRETLKALRQKFPNRRIWAVLEAHSFSRTKALLKDYEGVFENADELIVGPIFKARDTETFGITGAAIVAVSGHKKAIYKRSLSEIVSHLENGVDSGDVVLVMGAGKSYLWARDIAKSL